MSNASPRPPETSQLDLEKGFIIVGAVLALIVILTVCRLCFNVVLIDVCILHDLQSARQQLKDALDLVLCRRWRPEQGERSRPAEMNAASMNGSIEMNLVEWNSILAGISTEERTEVLNSMLVSKVRRDCSTFQCRLDALFGIYSSDCFRDPYETDHYGR